MLNEHVEAAILLLCSCISQNNAHQSLITKTYHMSVEHQTCSSYARLGTSMPSMPCSAKYQPMCTNGDTCAFIEHKTTGTDMHDQCMCGVPRDVRKQRNAEAALNKHPHRWLPGYQSWAVGVFSVSYSLLTGDRCCCCFRVAAPSI